jgi:crotonobetainyl-CoA:carnitine CoA-transferase CaiB-like acyl-CoA transferase
MPDQPTPPKLPPYSDAGRQAEPALKGIRVADFSHFIAGPYCTLILGDLGADVIKVENAAASGDHMRAFRPQIDGESAAFIWANRNKRSIALDLSIPAGQEVARALIATADVVVENFSASVMRRFGLDYASVAPANPRLIYCSVSAYGRSGPLADRTGFDPIAQAESGFMSLNGEAGSDPLRTGPAVMDMTTGMMASNAVLAALNARHRTGAGQQVEVALFDVSTAMLGFHSMNYLMTGVAPPRFGNNSRDTVPTGVFHCADGPIYLAIANDRLFKILVSEGLGRPDLAADPRFATNRDRVTNRDTVFETLGAIFATQPRELWLAKLRAAGVPAGAVRELPEAFASAEMAARGLATSIPHKHLGHVPNIASPLRLEATPVVTPVAAPLLGEHREEILALLGFDGRKVADLAAVGAFGKSGSSKA